MNIDDKFCIICYEKIGNLKFNTICSCKFYYHLDCYLEWNNVNPICLICRNPVAKHKILETINPLCLNTHIPAVRQYLEIDLSDTEIVTSDTQVITSETDDIVSEEVLTSRKCAISILLIIFLLLMCFTMLFILNFY